MPHLFQAVSPYAFTPSAEARRIDGTFVLHLSEPTEELTTRVFYSSLDDRFVALKERMLPIEQADHPSRRTVRSFFFRVTFVHPIFELGPVDLRQQNHQRVIWIENLFQMETAQTPLRIRAFGLCFLQTFRNLSNVACKFRRLKIARKPEFPSAFRLLQGRLSKAAIPCGALTRIGREDHHE